MQYKASEIIESALSLSQIHESESLSWYNKIDFLNTAYASLYDLIISHEDNFIVQHTLLDTFFPPDVYAIKGVYKGFKKLKRQDEYSKLLPDHYRIFNNQIEPSGVDLYYVANPPNITFPNKVVNLSGVNYKIRSNYLAHLDADTLTILNLTSEEENIYTIDPLYEWDIFNGLPVQNISGNLIIGEQILMSNVASFIVNTLSVDYKILNDDTVYSYNGDVTTTIDYFGNKIGDTYYTFIDNTLTDITLNYIIGQYQKVIFCDPYSIIKKDDRFYILEPNGEEEIINYPGEIVSGDWNDINGYGLLYQMNGDTVLRSFYPDTLLNWPNTLYFDWLKVAIAIDAKKMIQQDTTHLEDMKRERTERLLSYITRNRIDSYKLYNPYSKGL